MRKIVGLFSGGLFAISTIVGNASAQSSPFIFTESFNGGHSPNDPGPPGPWNPEDWDVQTHIRSAYEMPGRTIPHEADHGANCEAPGEAGDVTHTVTDIGDTVYQCANHIMTSFRADDFGQIAVTPPALVDFSEDEATIKFDMSTLSDSPRDWPSLVIQNYADNLAQPLQSHWPDLNGFSRNAILFDFRDGVICPVVFRNFEAAEGGDKFSGSCRWWDDISNYLSRSAQKRVTFVITVSRSRIKVEIPEIGLVFDDMEIADLGWDRGLVSLLHHSYEPLKDGGVAANTWHFDNLEIAPAQPIFIAQSRRRWANEDRAEFDFPRAAPANAYLRGTAIGTKLQVSFDNGITWSTTRQQPSGLQDKPTWQFWHPVPQGAKSVLVRAGEKSVAWWNSSWIAKDLSFFSLTTDYSPPAPPPGPALADCRTVAKVSERINGKWVVLDRKVTNYQSRDCLTGQP